MQLEIIDNKVVCVTTNTTTDEITSDSIFQNIVVFEMDVKQKQNEIEELYKLYAQVKDLETKLEKQ
jgi:hypothetical protein